MAYYQKVYAQIYNNIVMNITVFDDYSTANYITKATYGSDAFAIQCNQWRIGKDYKYNNKIFYLPDGETEADYIPTEEEEVNRLTEENNNLTLLMADMIGGV